MPSLLEISWLIPLAPLASALFIGGLLLSFSTTVNRLTKPVSFIIINCLGLSTILSLVLFLKHQTGEILRWRIKISQIDYTLSLILDNLSSILLLSTGFLFLIVMITSYYKLPRAKGYGRYFALLSFASGLLFLFILGGSYPGHQFV